MSQINQNNQKQLPSQCEVLIVGAGVSGATAFYSLQKAGVKNVVIVDTGKSGQGNDQGQTTSQHAYLREDDVNQSRVFEYASKSGSAVMDYPTSTIKMMVNLYPSTSKDYIQHHGFNGAVRYLKLAHTGLQIQSELAQIAFEKEQLNENLVQKGSLYVCEEKDVEDFKEEFELLKKLGCKGVELWDQEKVWKHAGGPQTKFVLGIYFPNDSVINSQLFSSKLIQNVLKIEPSYSLFENTPQVVNVKTSKEGFALTKLENGVVIKSNYVVVCTGGLFNDPNLAGILIPCYSYLVSLKEPESTKNDKNRLPYPNSLNFFTWGFTHDWCLTKGHLRCSGEDHFSALKPPRDAERCASLARWTVEKLPYLKDSELNCDKKYGVYSETPDSTPLVGTMSPQSKVCYVLGCNAWGQASLSYSASLVPGLLGYTNLNDDQKDSLKLLTIRRFALLKGVKKQQTPKL
ncbi:FAD-dependent oxidoreductase (macronuclear) [Tetrahymena thermophila SB210]|uniref:FAD-dependent oxidoreductase domain-containing protein 1 n=1 Tax=Tetrahymena thermophila (strain SB210) TaxID=312017 RepID=I7MG22_TETTS|nr:FAD-dependent oxidoreductase [Tetrahymena thermophila SB210]EAR84802.1 FAD-dependent oxidoreductase [Tetrahymena thermophila SB210]|eukprot:XP_001032465.1 FAD-dependent oxidoreductase [Tetrahymena thermophila SB210]